MKEVLIMTDEQLDRFLASVCNGEKHERFIDCYSLEIEEYLKSRGYVSVKGEGIYKQIKPTLRGQILLSAGGFTEKTRLKEEKKSEKEYQRRADRRTKIISWITVMISMAQLIIAIVKCSSGKCC